MFKNLLFLVALLSLSGATMLRLQISDLHQKNEKYIKVPLTYIEGAGYTIPVHFTKDDEAKNMILSLYSSDVILTEKCLQFSKYDCSQFATCNKSTSASVNVNYPSFGAVAKPVSTELIIKADAWSLGKKAPAYIADDCNTKVDGSYGSNTYGILGLGLNYGEDARNNFAQGVYGFAVYFESGAFKVLFHNYNNFPNGFMSVQTDNHWQIPNIIAMTYKTRFTELSGIRAIWDINTDGIGLPFDIYNTLIKSLAFYDIDCPEGIYYQAKCTFKKPLENFYLSVAPPHHIYFVPKIWALNVNGNQFTLGFKALSPNMTGVNYVHPDFQNAIILGDTVMKVYKHLFSFADSSVAIFDEESM